MANVTEAITDALLSGETLTGPMARDRWGCTSSNVQLVVKKLRSKGYRFTEEAPTKPSNMGGATAYTLSYVPDAETDETEGSTTVGFAPHLPELGSSMIVVGLVLDNDNNVVIALRAGAQTWTAEITGTNT